jgi:phage shock protein PspC (stress-responsive transcriptional regulator)
MKLATRSPVALIIGAGILAGTLNLAAAAMIFGGSAMHGFQMIASGLLGDRAFSSGSSTAGLGVALHYAISIVAAVLYWLMATRIRLLRDYWLVGGTAFGVLAYVIMNLIVVPMSNAASPDLSARIVVEDLAAHVLAFGIPIAGVLSMARRRRGVGASSA